MRIVYVLASPATRNYWSGDCNDWWADDPAGARWYGSLEDITMDIEMPVRLLDGNMLRIETWIV
jgi:hypothetical protein